MPDNALNGRFGEESANPGEVSRAVVYDKRPVPNEHMDRETLGIAVDLWATKLIRPVRLAVKGFAEPDRIRAVTNRNPPRLMAGYFVGSLTRFESRWSYAPLLDIIASVEFAVSDHARSSVKLASCLAFTD